MRPKQWFQPVYALKHVLTFTTSEVSSWTQYLHRISFCGPRALLLHFNLREQYILFISMMHPSGISWKEAFFHIWHQKSGFNLSTFRNRFQHSLLLKFHHALIIFIKFLFAALVHFYSALLQEGKIFCSSQWFIYGGFFEKKKFFRRWDQKSGFNLSTLRNTFQHSLLLKIHHSLIIFIKFIFAALVQVYSVLL